ncbi:MAG: Gfo/Idh/MocA family oxidoreductase, partial [bacterium]
MKEIDRRKFIMRSAGAAVGFSLLGKISRGASPNGTVRVVVVGVNGRGTDHLGGFAPLKGVEVAGICDVDENVLNKRLGEFEKKYGKRPKGYTDMRRVFDDKEIDAVSFATPN